MAAKKTMHKGKTAANALLFAAMALIALVALNIVASRFFGRVDLTEDKQFTLSRASKDLVAKLPDRMTVKAFISEDLQPPFKQTAQYVRDMLDEYAQASKGKLKWEAIDPGTNKQLEEEATKLKVPKMRRGRISSNKLEIGSSYLGVAFQYQGNIESIPEINSTDGLEFQMTSIIKMLSVKKRKVAFATSENELQVAGDPQRGQPGGLGNLNAVLKDFEVTSVSLAKSIPDDVDALVIAGPKQPMSERAKFVVDQFLMKGKSVAILVNGMVIESPQQMQMKIPGMEQPRVGHKNDGVPDDLLEHYGVKVRDDLVFEPMNNAPGPIPLNGQLVLKAHPGFVIATRLHEKDPLVAGVRGIIFPFPSSLELLKDKQPGAQVTKVAESSPEAWRQGGFFLLDGESTPKPSEDRGPFTIAVAQTGKFKSMFAGKPYQNEKGETVQPPAPNSSLPPGTEKPLDESVGSPRLLVVADANFASDDYIGMARYFQGYVVNLQFAFNIIDWLTQDDTLSKVRAKSVTGRPLTYKNESTPTLVKLANIAGVPFAFILFGIIRWRVRSARRRHVEI